MGLFLFGFLFPPLWILGAVLGARAASAAETATATKGADVGVAAAADTGGESGRVRAMRVWGVANGVLAAFSAVVAVALVIWGASTGFAWH
ncbi:hypothetical protein DFJ73DRAFT_808732 [Zopfochytrium polystomum]|nr:hypothetical protein DFJ73DRAFT_808732 [Zopfochytrium polystomum]